MTEISSRSYTIPLFQVDAFTTQQFKGNPAAVCILNGPMEESTMQAIAAEMNLSETAFVYPLKETPIERADSFSLRWFTPKIEVPLCGHATLATSHVLFNEIGVASNCIRYQTMSGELMARTQENGIILDFPAYDPVSISPPPGLVNALGISPPLESTYSRDMKMLMILLRDEKEVRELEPDFQGLLRTKTGMDILGIIITAAGTPPVDFVSRFFAPWLGIDEDPVTGAAHTILAPYWSKRLGKKRMNASQLSERGGELEVHVLPGKRVELTANAVTVLKGELFIPSIAKNSR